RDLSGSIFTITGGMVTIGSSPILLETGSGPPPPPPPVVPSTPTLSLPAFLPLNATITAGYAGSDPASYFSWSFTPVAQIPAVSPTGNRGQGTGALAAVAPSASFTTSSPLANLSAVNLGLGPYLVAVTVTDINGQTSAPAQAYVTMAASDLTGVRVC